MQLVTLRRRQPFGKLGEQFGTAYATEDQSSNSAFLINGNWLDKDQGKSVHKYIYDQFNVIYDTTQQGKDIPMSKISSGESSNALIAKEMITLMRNEKLSSGRQLVLDRSTKHNSVKREISYTKSILCRLIVFM